MTTTHPKMTPSLDQHIRDYLYHTDPFAEKSTPEELKALIRGFEEESNSGFTTEEMDTPEYDPSIIDRQFMLPISIASSKSAHGRSGVKRR